MPTYWGKSVKINLAVVRPPSSDQAVNSRTSTPYLPDPNADPLPPHREPLEEETFREPEDVGDLKFLGERKDIPFFIVRADPETSTAENGYKSRQRYPACSNGQLGERERGPSIPVLAGEPPLELKRLYETAAREVGAHDSRGDLPSSLALSLVVSLSEASLAPFDVRAPNASKANLSPAKKAELSFDLYIVVYLNGEFVSSRCVQANTRHGRGIRIDRSPVFSGRKTTTYREHAWVVKDSGQALHKRCRTTSVETDAVGQRWSSISDQLKYEAERWDMAGDEDGASILTDYLQSLAALEMSDKMKDALNEKQHDQSFGIFDIALVRGKVERTGNANSFLKRPATFSDLRDDAIVGQAGQGRRRSGKMASLRLKLSQVEETSNPVEPPEQQVDAQIANAQAVPEKSVTDRGKQVSALLQASPPVDQQVLPFRESRQSSPATQLSPTRTRSNAKHGGVESTSLVFRHRDTDPHNAGILRHEAETTTSSSTSSRTLSNVSGSGTSTSSRTISARHSSTSTAATKSTTSSTSTRSPEKDAVPYDWVSGNLHEGCVVGYADGFTTDPLVDANGMRIVQKEKSSPFQGEDILVAMRFVVG